MLMVGDCEREPRLSCRAAPWARRVRVDVIAQPLAQVEVRVGHGRSGEAPVLRVSGIAGWRRKRLCAVIAVMLVIWYRTSS